MFFYAGFFQLTIKSSCLADRISEWMDLIVDKYDWPNSRNGEKKSGWFLIFLIILYMIKINLS